jgi:hypothetical protein
VLGDRIREIGIHRQWTRDRQEAWWNARQGDPELHLTDTEPAASLASRRLDTLPPPA